jgi:phosphoglycolate phosphatase
VIRGVLFDKDGTLFDYQGSWAPINLDAARLASCGDEGLRVRLLALAGADPVTGHAVADSLLAAGNAAEIAARWVAAGCPMAVAALTAQLDILFLQAASRMLPVTDLPGLFRRLKDRGLKLGIASSDSEAAVHEAASIFGFAPWLDFVAGYDSGHGHKPTGGMALAFCRATGLASADIAVVGDNTHDMEMGRRAGAGLRIGVLTGSGTRESLLPCADACLGGIDQLEAFLAPHLAAG